MCDNDENDDNLSILQMGKPTYFYRVSEYVTTFKKGENFSDKVDFRTGDLMKDRGAALEYYQERLDGFESGKAKFHHTFQSPENFIHGASSAYSLVLSLIEYYNDGSYCDYPLLGEDEEICEENRELEVDIINKQQDNPL